MANHKFVKEARTSAKAIPEDIWVPKLSIRQVETSLPIWLMSRIVTLTMKTIRRIVNIDVLAVSTTFSEAELYCSKTYEVNEKW